MRTGLEPPYHKTVREWRKFEMEPTPAGYPIMPQDWVWQGHYGHLSVGDRCQFRMTTRVGDVLVSTMGEYFPSDDSEKMDTLSLIPKSYYETMLFRCEIDNQEECGCAILTEGCELDVKHYSTAKEATSGHMCYCYRAALGKYSG